MERKQRKSVRDLMGEEGAQSAGLPPKVRELNHRKKVNAVVLDFTKASGPTFKQHQPKHPTKLGDPGILSNQHLQVKTLKSVQKQNDALLKANQGLNQDFADNINAFFAADVKTASEV